MVNMVPVTRGTKNNDCFYDSKQRPTHLFQVIYAHLENRRGCIFMQCVRSSWQHEKKKKKATRSNKKKKKKMCQIFLGTWWGSGTACQPPVGETKPKQSVSMSVSVHVCFLRARACVCVCVCVCVCARNCWLEKCGFLQELTKPWKHVMTESGEHTQSLMWAHMPTHAHTHTHTHTHTGWGTFTFTNAHSVKAVTADGAT